ENDGIGGDDTDETAGGGENGGFGHELKEDVLLPGAEGTTEADLSRAFGDAGEHDVHDDDAADDEENTDEGHGNESDVLCQVVPQAHDGIGADNAEIIGGVVRKMTPGAEEHAGFVLASGHEFLVGRLDENGDPILAGVPTFAPSVERYDHVVVLRLAESATERLGNSNHFVGVRLYTECFSDGIHVREEFGGEIRADEDDFGTVIVIGLSDETTLSDREIADVGKVGGAADHLDVFHGQIATLHHDSVVFLGSDRGGELHIVAEALVVLVSNHWALLGFNPCIFTCDDAEAVDNKNVGSEIGDAVGDVHVEAGDDAHDGDESGNGENASEKGQEAAEFVGAEGAESKFKGFAEGDPGGAGALGAGRHPGEAVQRRNTGQTVQGDNAQGELLIRDTKEGA